MRRLKYSLPKPLLDEYHRLVDKKFTLGLTPEEENALTKCGADLDEADANTELERCIRAKAEREHAERMALLNDVLAQLKAL